MSYRELYVLLPCHSLEDFPLHYEGAEADELLTCWTVLWHPALIAAAATAPNWRRADEPPYQLDGRLLAIPSISRHSLPSGFAAKAQEAGAVVLEDGSREDLLARALHGLPPESAAVAPELAADFLALGYGYLQVELLTRQMRYASNLDEVRFRENLLLAARAAVQQDEATARKHLTSCFNMLGEERDHYYSVDAFLLDLTLLAETTLGAGLVRQLASDVPLNLLVSGQVLRRLAEQAPTTLQRIRERLEQATLDVVGGEAEELPLPLLSLEAAHEQLRRGLDEYTALLGRRPRVFGRRRFGLSPLLPQVLHKFDFHGAIHATLDDGKFPQAGQSKTRWEGLDGTALDALTRVPLDASQPGTFLALASKLSQAMDSDHVATICLAHWPGAACRWYDELQRVARYTSALGKFLTFDSYFRETDLPGYLDRFTFDQYVTPYLKQSITQRETDPISSVQRYWRDETRRQADAGLDCLAVMLDPVHGRADAAMHREPLERFAAALPRSTEPEPGCLIANPYLFARRVAVELPASFGRIAPQAAIVAHEQADDAVQAIVELPPAGFVWLQTQSDTGTRREKPGPKLATQHVLRNEFFEAHINPTTGGLVSIRSYQVRANLLSQQLAFRLPLQAAGAGPADPNAGYSQMLARSVRVTRSTNLVGEICAEGVLLDAERHELAGFRQTFRVWRGLPVLELDIELTPHVEPRADAWNSYYACRFAWGDDEAMLARSCQQTRQAVRGHRFEAPQFIEIDDGHHKVAILTGGLPYHQRTAPRALDTLLIVRGESQRRFRLGIGPDLAHPLVDALRLLHADSILPQRAAPPAPVTAGWLLHTGVKNVTATHWEPLWEGGHCSGFRARLLETAGAATRLTLSAFRPLAAARLLDFNGQSRGDCRVDQGKVHLDFAPYEWIELEARWSPSGHA